jgi:hypothetical protein
MKRSSLQKESVYLLQKRFMGSALFKKAGVFYNCEPNRKIIAKPDRINVTARFKKCKQLFEY